MEQSILLSTKKLLGLAEDYDPFDTDVLLGINSAFSTLSDLGVGPESFAISSSDAEWSSFLDEGDNRLATVKMYVYLKTRMQFDPPSTSFVIEAYEKQLVEMEWRLNVRSEKAGWTDPDPHISKEV